MSRSGFVTETGNPTPGKVGVHDHAVPLLESCECATGWVQEPRWAAFHLAHAEAGLNMDRLRELEAIARDLEARGVPEEIPCSQCHGTSRRPTPQGAELLSLVGWWAETRNLHRRLTGPPPPIGTQV